MLLSGLALLACALTAAPSGQIAFVAGTEQEDQTVTVLDVASGELRSIGPGRRDGAPRWSPDGQWLAFESQIEGGLGICVAAADGSAQRILPTEYTWNQQPRWSTDGCGRAVCPQNICGRYLLYTANAGGGLLQRLMVYDLQEEREDAWAGARDGMSRPVWLPNLNLTLALNPEHIHEAFAQLDVDKDAFDQELTEAGAVLALHVVERGNQRATELSLVTKSYAVPLIALLPGAEDSTRYQEWAVEPDRRAARLAFESNNGGDREIFVLHRKGLTNVSNHRAADWNPVWSPAGDWLAFESFRSGRRGLYRVFPDTALVEVIDASDVYSAWHPTWSPNGKWVAYVADATGTPRIHLRDPQGRNHRQLTDSPGYQVAPAWRPEVR